MEYVMGAIFLILFMVINLFLLFFGDRLVIKTRFSNYQPIEAEVIGFDTVQYFRGGDKVTIVTVSTNGKSKDFVLLRSRADKIGAKTPIYTKGDFVVRAKYALTEYVSFGGIVMWLILILGMLQYVILHLEKVSMPILFVEILMLILYLLVYPFLYEIHNQMMQQCWRGH